MKLHATNKDLVIKECERLISGSVNVYTCEFTFDESWDGYSVTAVFSVGNRLVNMAVVDGKCDIPAEVLRPNARLRVGIFGTDGVKSRPTTYSDWIPVEQGADMTGKAGEPPTPSVYEQWMNALDEKHDEWNANEQARVEAEQAREDLETGYVAQAQEAAETAEMWANATRNMVEGDFATVTELETVAELSATEKAMSGIRRKLNALAGNARATFKEHNAEIEAHNAEIEKHNADLGKRRVTVSYATADRVRFQCSTDDGYRLCTLLLDPTKATCYQIPFLSNYNIYNLFSSKSADKTLVGLWLDGTRYDTTDVLKDTTLSFDNMVLLYTVNEGSYTINTCLCISADGIKIYESIPERLEEIGVENPLIKTCLTGANTVTPLVSGENLLIFTMMGGDRFFIQTVEDLGQTVVKTIAFNGRL